LELQLTPQEIKERQDYAVSQNIVILRTSPQQPGARGIGAAGRPRGRGSHRHSAAGPAKFSRGQENPRQTATLEFRMVDETNNPLEAAATGRVPLG